MLYFLYFGHRKQKKVSAYTLEIKDGIRNFWRRDIDATHSSFSHSKQNCQICQLGKSKDFIAAKKVTPSRARSDDHCIKSIMLIQLCYHFFRQFPLNNCLKKSTCTRPRSAKFFEIAINFGIVQHIFHNLRNVVELNNLLSVPPSWCQFD